MQGYETAPSGRTARRLRKEKRRAVLYWGVGAVVLVAAVAGMLVVLSLRRPI